MTKVCFNCNKEKDIEEFQFRKDTKKYRNQCKKCYYTDRKRYHQKNKEEIAEKQKQYREENREEILKNQKQYYEKNREEILEYQKQYREENKEKINKYDRKRNKTKKRKECRKQYLEKNKEEHKEKKREYDKWYYKKNKEKVNKYRNEYEKKRRQNEPEYKLKNNLSWLVRFCLKQNNLTKQGQKTFDMLNYTLQDLKNHLEKQFDSNMTWKNYGYWHIDHIIPQSYYSFDSIGHPNFKKCWSLRNLRPLEAKENESKGNKIDENLIKEYKIEDLL